MSRMLALFVSSVLLSVGDAKQSLIDSIESRRAHYAEIAEQIWRQPELGYLEEHSSALLATELEKQGFEVRRAVAGIPTAFTASYGSGKPVIAVLGEFDALPGMSQAALPEQKVVTAGAPGHACGHNLFGTGSMAAAIAVKEWMTSTKHAGTVRFYGTPAEEGGGGKLYMLRAGLFADVDVALAWHPADRNDLSEARSLAAIGADFRFHGVAAHASIAPDKGRSALDGVESMDFMINMMREHIPSAARIHYVITSGGKAPNIVPEFASSSYIVRHPDLEVLDALWQRVLGAANGAASGTGTTMDYEVISFYYPILGNSALTELQRKNFERVGGVKYTKDEQAFAESLAKTLPSGGLAIGSQESIAAPDPMSALGSTDVGDVSWNVPTGHMDIATWVPGTPPHTWQAVAAAGSSIGEKGMIVAAKTLALTAFDLLDDPAKVAAARAEFDKRVGSRAYTWRLGDRKPPLDYRRN